MMMLEMHWLTLALLLYPVCPLHSDFGSNLTQREPLKDDTGHRLQPSTHLESSNNSTGQPSGWSDEHLSNATEQDVRESSSTSEPEPTNFHTRGSPSESIQLLPGSSSLDGGAVKAPSDPSRFSRGGTGSLREAKNDFFGSTTPDDAADVKTDKSSSISESLLAVKTNGSLYAHNKSAPDSNDFEDIREKTEEPSFFDLLLTSANGTDTEASSFGGLNSNFSLPVKVFSNVTANVQSWTRNFTAVGSGSEIQLTPAGSDEVNSEDSTRKVKIQQRSASSQGAPGRPGPPDSDSRETTGRSEPYVWDKAKKTPQEYLQGYSCIPREVITQDDADTTRNSTLDRCFDMRPFPCYCTIASGQYASADDNGSGSGSRSLDALAEDEASAPAADDPFCAMGGCCPKRALQDDSGSEDVAKSWSWPDTKKPRNVVSELRSGRYTGCLMDTYNAYFAIVRCPVDYPKKAVREVCENRSRTDDPYSEKPVSDPATQVVYRNRHCALCHGVDTFVPWVRQVSCTTFQFLYHVKTESEMLDVITGDKDGPLAECFVNYGPPREVSQIIPVCPTLAFDHHYDKQSILINTCNETGQWASYDADVERGCLTFTGFEFRLLPGSELNEVHSVTPFKDQEAPSLLGEHFYYQLDPSHMGLKDRTDLEPDDATETPFPCRPGQWLTFDNVCRNISCSEGKVLNGKNNTCITSLHIMRRLAYGCRISLLPKTSMILTMAMHGRGNKSTLWASTERAFYGMLTDILETATRAKMDALATGTSYEMEFSVYAGRYTQRRKDGVDELVYTVEMIAVNAKLEASVHVERDQAEEMLISTLLLQDWQLYVQSESKTFGFKPYSTAGEKHLGIQYAISKPMDVIHLSTKQNERLLLLRHFIPLTRFLTCSVVSFGPEEFEIGQTLEYPHQTLDDSTTPTARESQFVASRLPKPAWKRSSGPVRIHQEPLASETTETTGSNEMRSTTELTATARDLVADVFSRPASTAASPLDGTNEPKDCLPCEAEHSEKWTITLMQKKISMLEAQFSWNIRDDGRLYICADTLQDLFDVSTSRRREKTKRFEEQFWQYALSMTAIPVSIFCLVLVLIVYAVLPELRTQPGLNTMGTCTTLLVAQASLLLASHRVVSGAWCSALGVLVHLSWLSTFCWTSVCSVHMLRSFSRKTIPRCRPGSYRVLATNSAVTVLLPGAMVAAVVGLSWHRSGGRSIGYSGTTCYFQSPLMVGLFVVLPLSLIVALNLLLYSLTVWQIHKVIQLQGRVAHSVINSGNQHVSACLRLSLLTGITWVLSLLAEGLDLTWLRTVSILANGSQGLLLLMSFIATRRVASMLARRMNCCTENITTRSSEQL